MGETFAGVHLAIAGISLHFSLTLPFLEGFLKSTRMGLDSSLAVAGLKPTAVDIFLVEV